LKEKGTGKKKKKMKVNTPCVYLWNFILKVTFYDVFEDEITGGI